MSLRRRDVELWMSHRRLPEELRRYYSLRFQTYLILVIIRVDDPALFLSFLAYAQIF